MEKQIPSSAGSPRRYAFPPEIAVVVAFSLVIFLLGINWGLPSRQNDPVLFGDRTPWTGRQIMQLAGPWAPPSGQGSDIALHAITDRRQPIDLNDTDAKRAEIVRRYRLYSNQPDEMNTFRSLSRMRPGSLDLDPRMYQYGGLWIYPVGLLLKAGSWLKLVTLQGDPAFYLDHPEQFARFYIVARLYTVLWATIGAVFVYLIARQWCGDRFIATTAGLLYAVLPVVVSLSHEAKPHLPGVALTLATICFGLDWMRTGQRRSWWAAVVAAGMAVGMVLTGYVAFAVLAVAPLCRVMPWKRRAAMVISGGLTGLLVFVVTNPFLFFDLLFRRASLQSNVGNYGTFYQPGLSLAGITNAAGLIVAGASPFLVISALTASALMLVYGLIHLKNSRREKTVPISVFSHRGFWVMGSAVAGLNGLQFLLLAAGKPAEYARFAVISDVLLALAVVAMISRLEHRAVKRALAVIVLIGTTVFGWRYDVNYLADRGPQSSRDRMSSRLQSLAGTYRTLAVPAEPAPYGLPAVDLFSWRIVLLPRDSEIREFPNLLPAVTVKPVDAPLDRDETASPISWANKPMEVNAVR